MTFEQKKQLVIDNCFKVDCNINMTLKEAYEKGFNRGLSKAPKPKVEKTQGEWIEKSLTIEKTLNCSICGAKPRQSVYGYYLPDNFCPNCGAEMRKGDTNDG